MKLHRLLLTLILAAAAVSAAPPSNLNFFKNYFLTGDYSVAGVGLQGTGVGGTATGFIAIADVRRMALLANHGQRTRGSSHV